MTRAAGPLTVLYDADCGLCRHTARTLRVLDVRRRLRFRPLQADERGERSPNELLARLHARDDRGRWTAGGDAALRIAREIPVLFPLWLAGRLPGGRAAAGAAYELVARHRHAIGAWLGLAHCRFDPDGPTA